VVAVAISYINAIIKARFNQNHSKIMVPRKTQQLKTQLHNLMDLKLKEQLLAKKEMALHSNWNP